MGVSQRSMKGFGPSWGQISGDASGNVEEKSAGVPTATAAIRDSAGPSSSSVSILGTTQSLAPREASRTRGDSVSTAAADLSHQLNMRSLHAHLHVEELLDDFDIRRRVRRQRRRVERAAARQCQRDEKLIGQMRPDRHAGGQERLGLGNRRPGDLLRRDAAFAEAGERSRSHRPGRCESSSHCRVRLSC